MNVEQCLAEGLLKKTAPDRGKAARSLVLAGQKLQLARKELAAGIFEDVVVSAYTSMFHSARALLYADGFKERSHYAVCVYVAERHSDKIERKYLNELNALRMERHELMYGLEERPQVSEAEAAKVIQVAEGFLKSAERVLSGKGFGAGN